MKFVVKHEGRQFLEFGKVKNYPSITSWFKWQFVVENENNIIVGERSFITGKVKILKELEKMDEKELEQILNSKIGEFFQDFTPIFHVESSEYNGSITYTFMDLRYWIKNNFLHHATLELDQNENIVSSSFHPYSVKRKVELTE